MSHDPAGLPEVANFMIMNRRQILKRIAMGATAAILLPSCISDPKKVSIALNSLAVTGNEEGLLAEIAETMIPATDTPGAKTTEAHLFTLVMIDDCADKETKEKYLKGLRSFDDVCAGIGGKTFMGASPEERLQMLQEIESRLESLDDGTRTFYQTSRRYILQGYVSSSYFMTAVKPYELVPGPGFRGCVPVENPKSV